MSDDSPKLILLTGTSGSGLSTALNILEDNGIKVVDNLPMALIDQLVALEVESEGRSLAIGLDARTTGFSAEAVKRLVANLRDRFGARFTTVFIGASHDDLLRRFNTTRRQHPLAGEMTIDDAVRADIMRMDEVAPLADIQLDTSGVKPANLRSLLLAALRLEEDFKTDIRIVSFSYRLRLPDHSDLVIDMRFANNPHWNDDLRAKTGLDPEVDAFLCEDAAAMKVIDAYKTILTEMLGRMTAEGRPILNVAFGCTGGKHRSVWAAKTIGSWLRDQGYAVDIRNREIGQI